MLFIVCSSNNGRKLPLLTANGHAEAGSNFISRRSEAVLVPWMPTSILGGSIFLGSLDQTANPSVIRGLGITHVVSIGRCKEIFDWFVSIAFDVFLFRSPYWRDNSVNYLGIDGDKNLYMAILSGTEFIHSAIEQVRRHGFFVGLCWINLI